MKLIAALLLIASTQSALGLGISDYSKVQADINALQAKGLVCVYQTPEGQDVKSGQIIQNVLCGKTEDTATELMGVITIAISNPGSRCEDHTAIAFEKPAAAM